MSFLGQVASHDARRWTTQRIESGMSHYRLTRFIDKTATFRTMNWFPQIYAAGGRRPEKSSPKRGNSAHYDKRTMLFSLRPQSHHSRESFDSLLAANINCARSESIENCAIIMPDKSHERASSRIPIGNHFMRSRGVFLLFSKTNMDCCSWVRARAREIRYNPLPDKIGAVSRPAGMCLRLRGRNAN